MLREEEYGRVLTSDYVYDEVVTLTQKRTESVDDGIAIGRRIRGEGYPDAIEMSYATPALFDTAVETQETYADQDLSFTDAMTVAMIEHHEIDAVLSFDDDFDGVVDRLAPERIVK